MSLLWPRHFKYSVIDEKGRKKKERKKLSNERSAKEDFTRDQ